VRLAAAALAVLTALTAYAQTPPDTAPPPAEPAQAAPAEAPAGETPSAAAPLEALPLEAPAPPPARASAPRAASTHASPPPAREVERPAPDRDGELASLRAEVGRLQAELDAERAAAAAPSAGEAGTLADPVRGAWEWVVTAALLALAAGFVLGWRVLDRRIRRKYGGLRIY